METIFDFDLSEEERKRLARRYATKEEYIRYLSGDDDRRILDLFYLFMHRRDYERAKHYLSMFKSRKYREEIYRCYWGDIISDEDDAEMERADEIFKDIL